MHLIAFIEGLWKVQCYHHHHQIQIHLLLHDHCLRKRYKYQEIIIHPECLSYHQTLHKTIIDLDPTTSNKISSPSTHTSIDSENENSSISSWNSKTKRILQSSSSSDQCNPKNFLLKLSSDKHGHQSNSHTSNNNDKISDYKLSSK